MNMKFFPKLTLPGMMLAVAVLYLIATNLVWISIDTQPPFWDMAYHQSRALHVLDSFAAHGWRAIPLAAKETGNYPPLYYLILSLFYAVFGRAAFAAQLANLPAIVLLAFATHGIAKKFLDPPAAAVAAILAGFFPFMIWISRESLIEYWLVALVAAAMLALLRADASGSRRHWLIFGATCGLGMLAKWTFPIYLWLPAIWCARKNFKKALAAAGLTCLISGYWYISNAGKFKAIWQLAASGGKNEGDPAAFSWQSLVFYIRVLEGYQLFLPLFVLFIAAIAVMMFHSKDKPGESWTPIFLWLLGGWFGLILISNKDPRYSLPLLPAVAIVGSVLFQKRRIAVAMLMVFLVFQHYLVSFGIPLLPERSVLVRGRQGPISWDWNLYSQTYFNVLGKPVRGDWPIEKILLEITSARPAPVKLGIIPDIPRCDSHAFEFFINLRHYPVIVNTLWTYDEAAFFQNDYVLFSGRDQGFLPYSSPDSERIISYIVDHAPEFRVVRTYKLPSGQSIELRKVERKIRTQSDP
jgi:hypothetical protein